MVDDYDRPKELRSAAIKYHASQIEKVGGGKPFSQKAAGLKNGVFN